ncbi:MAG: Amino-acid acetyltransferase, mitochondrial [Alyxoria varia]|nr:MAG: Amino-acid acetyltransferase, mitochondrial [Alyxoria varia]
MKPQVWVQRLSSQVCFTKVSACEIIQLEQEQTYNDSPLILHSTKVQVDDLQVQNANHSNGTCSEALIATTTFANSIVNCRKSEYDNDVYFGRKTGQKESNEAAKDLIRDLPAVTHAPRHVALIKLRAPQLLDDEIVQGLARTMSQVKRLGLHCVVVLDPEQDDYSALHDSNSLRRTALEQSDRLVSELQKQTKIRACRLDDAFNAVNISREVTPTVPVQGAVEVNHRDLIARPLSRGIIPIIPPVAFTEESQQRINVQSDDIVLALTREFAGLNRHSTSASTEGSDSQDVEVLEKTRLRTFILDRIILLDPIGGIPSFSRSEKPHVFVNLEQEYGGIRDQMFEAAEARNDGFERNMKTTDSEGRSESSLGSSNPISKFLETQSGLVTPPKPEHHLQTEGESALPYQRHLKNLNLLRHNLALLPPTSSALLTTPQEAATLAEVDTEDVTPGVKTRRAKNPLIFNLLTDKPLVSSSLPQARLKTYSDGARTAAVQTTAATFVKRGMPVTIIPEPQSTGWQPPGPGMKTVSLEDPRIDFPRLLNLIEDSFNRPLDVNHYLERIRNRIAGVIIAGEYEGGALLTWELPRGVSEDSKDSTQHMVPYLDKFAVLKRSQGAGGVADIVFSAMTRACFPEGVCWRSRKDNPVNKWYFERSEGTLKIPSTNWAMFWTTKDLTESKATFLDYESVCRQVQPSWADNRHIVD